ncbi:MAG TPA: hypothetical protein VNA25_01370 [Phycisphaerae bacterium]|nr:hypothetical protein [Phycisphaerae bacterium]
MEPVTPGLLAVAERLRGLGLITYRQGEYVCCAFTEDEDFPHSNRTCTGRLPIKATLDENAMDYRCPECRRIVYPNRHKKRRFQEVRVKILEDGVRAYIEQLLAELGDDVRTVDGIPHVWRIDGGLAGIHVCLADFCDDQRVLSVQWAQQNPTCYVAVNPRAIERFIQVAWVPRIMLADLVVGTIRLADKVREIGAKGTQCDLPLLATPAYSKGAHRPEVVASEEHTPMGLFVMEFGEKTVRINGMDMLDTRARTGYAILGELAKAFLQDLVANTAPQHFLCQTPSELADALQEAADKKDAMDADQVRRTINRLQDAFEQRLCKAGLTAEHDSIIQASPDTAKEGYRLNPFRVAIRPLLPQKMPK